nr:hypothetical protein [Candidatus Sigynarchaeum springense]
MLTDEKRNKYLNLLIGIAVGAILGFIFAMFVSGSITQAWTWKISPPYNTSPISIPMGPDPSTGFVRIDVFATTMVGCIIAIAFTVGYIYIVEWSKIGKRNAKVATKEAE